MEPIVCEKFSLGQVIATASLVMALEDDRATEIIHECLRRHASGDWGDLTEPDKQMNERAVMRADDRILSRYDFPEIDVYVITEQDRSYTTVMRVSDY